MVGEVERVDEAAQTVHLADGERLAYDQLVLATGSRIVPEAIEHFDTEAHHFYTAEAALELRQALDAFTGGRIVIGIAGMPYKCPPAPLEVAFLIEAELRERGLREKSELHFCSPIGRAFTIESVSEMATPILEREGHRAAHVLQRRDDRRRSARSSRASRARSCRTTCSSSCRRTRASSSSSTPGSRRRRAAGCRPTGRRSRSAAGRTSIALGDATDLPLSKAGSTAHFEAPVVTERIAAAIEGREVDHARGDYLGKVMCFFEVGDGKGTLLQFDYDHPPRPPKPNQLWHLGKIVFNKTYWHTVPKGRV